MSVDMQQHPWRVLKYAFDHSLEDLCVPLPVGTRVVHVEAQRGFVCMWMLVPHTQVDTELRERRFVVRMTGQELERGLAYRGTCLLDSGSFVAHVFEVESL